MTVCSIGYYGSYFFLYLFFFKPRSLIWGREASLEQLKWIEKYSDHYFPRPDFAYFKAEEGRCYFRHVTQIVSPSLEIGYEDGRISAFHTGGHRFDVGLEYDPAVLGKTPLFPNYSSIVAGSFQRIPFPDAHFGSVTAIHVLDHIPDLDACLAETARVLQSGGNFLFSLFSQRTQEVLSENTIQSFQLHNFLSQGEWAVLLRRHGFEVIACEDFTCSKLFLHLYFLGMKGLVPHDRSLIFGLLNRKFPWGWKLSRWILRDVVRSVYLDSHLQPAETRAGRGFNLFILARKI